MNTILLIEDDKDLNVGLTYDLEAENYKVYSTLTLGEGMSVLSEKEVDLILLDGNLRVIFRLSSSPPGIWNGMS